MDRQTGKGETIGPSTDSRGPKVKQRVFLANECCEDLFYCTGKLVNIYKTKLKFSQCN